MEEIIIILQLNFDTKGKYITLINEHITITSQDKLRPLSGVNQNDILRAVYTGPLSHGYDLGKARQVKKPNLGNTNI